MKSTSGFTLVEVIVICIVIGILAMIGIVTYQSIQTDSRDNNRLAHATAIAASLERYYERNGEYPLCSELTQSASTVRSDVLTTIEISILTAPKNSSDNALSCTEVTPATTTDNYSYTGTCDASACSDFTLKFKYETDGTVHSIESKRS